MAETNFSGPVNSEAGLLSGPFTEATAPTDPTTGQLAYFSDLGGSATWAQWDGSAWTAVGGGGGGGGSQTVTIFRTGTASVVELDPPSAVGHVYNISVPLPITGGLAVTILPPAVNGSEHVFVGGFTTIVYYPNAIAFTGGTSSSDNAITVLAANVDKSASIQLVYIGDANNYSQYQIISSTYLSEDTTTPRIFEYIP